MPPIGTTHDGSDIVVVDDDPDMRAVLCAVLLDLTGTEPKTFVNGSSVLEYLRESAPPQVMLLDVEMPGIDGIAVLLAVRECHPDVLVIMMSGADHEAAAIQSGADHFLHKPFTLEELTNLLDSGLR